MVEQHRRDGFQVDVKRDGADAAGNERSRCRWVTQPEMIETDTVGPHCSTETRNNRGSLPVPERVFSLPVPRVGSPGSYSSYPPLDAADDVRPPFEGRPVTIRGATTPSAAAARFSRRSRNRVLDSSMERFRLRARAREGVTVASKRADVSSASGNGGQVAGQDTGQRRNLPVLVQAHATRSRRGAVRCWATQNLRAPVGVSSDQEHLGRWWWSRGGARGAVVSSTTIGRGLRRRVSARLRHVITT